MLTLHHADQGSNQVEFVVRVNARHFRRFTAQQADVVISASLGDTPNCRRHHGWLELAHADVIEEKQRLGSLNQSIVNAVLDQAAADKRQEALGKNISTAMYTTAFGLIVAVPCLGMHIFLTNVTKKIIDEIDQYSVKLENLLISRGKSGASGDDR